MYIFVVAKYNLVIFIVYSRIPFNLKTLSPPQQNYPFCPQQGNFINKQSDKRKII